MDPQDSLGGLTERCGGLGTPCARPIQADRLRVFLPDRLRITTFTVDKLEDVPMSHGKINYQTALLSIALLTQLSAPPADGEEISVVAERYLAAIQSQNWETMQTMLAADARYRDFSMEHFGTPMIDLRGPEAIVGFWRESSNDSGTVSIRLDLPDRFVAGPNLVLRGHSQVRVRGSAWDLPLELIETRFPLITHLRIVDGKVTHHVDHVDYAAAERQISEQVESYNREHGTQASFPVSAVDDELRGQATAYLAALHQDDWEGLRRWLGPESRYLNFTAEAVSGSVERAEGGARMVDLFRNARARSGTLELKLEVRQSFVAGPNVLLVGTYHVVTRGEAWGVERDTVSFQIPMVVHLRIVEGMVLDHVEYLDYATGLSVLKREPERCGNVSRLFRGFSLTLMLGDQLEDNGHELDRYLHHCLGILEGRLVLSDSLFLALPLVVLQDSEDPILVPAWGKSALLHRFLLLRRR